jgi:hypothetical protein
VICRHTWAHNLDVFQAYEGRKDLSRVDEDKETVMSRLRVIDFVVTLDGYATGEDRSTEAACCTAQSEFFLGFEKANVLRPVDQLARRYWRRA